MMGDKGEKKKGRSVRSREGRKVWVRLDGWMDGNTTRGWDCFLATWQDVTDN